MTLDATLLARLAKWRPGGGRQTLNVPNEGSGWGVSLTADRADDVGCLVWEMTVRRAAPAAGGDAAALKGWAERVARRATGLLESLKVVEVDAARDEAILRSDEPARRGEDLFYYEVHLKGSGSAAVRRYQGARTGAGRREQVGFAVTHEALAKLAADLTAEK
jgi:hypothetical protein